MSASENLMFTRRLGRITREGAIRCVAALCAGAFALALQVPATQSAWAADMQTAAVEEQGSDADSVTSPSAADSSAVADDAGTAPEAGTASDAASSDSAASGAAAAGTGAAADSAASPDTDGADAGSDASTGASTPSATAPATTPATPATSGASSDPAPVTPSKEDGKPSPSDLVQDKVTVVYKTKAGNLIKDDKGYKFQKKDGSFATGTFMTIAGNRYYFAKNGYAYRSQVKKIGGYWYRFNGSACQKTGWYTWDDGKKSYFKAGNHNGAALLGHQKVSGKYYYFNKTDAKTKGGWVTVAKGKKAYFAKMLGYASPANRVYRAGKDGKYYAFDSKGMRRYGWVVWSKNRFSYAGKGGVLLTGKKRLYGAQFKFSKSGVAKYGTLAKMVRKAQRQTSATSYLMMVDINHTHTAVFKRHGSEWYLYKDKYWLCSCGMEKPETYTPEGSFRIGWRGYEFGSEKGYSCYWYTQIVGQVMFHSRCYYPFSNRLKDKRLGGHRTHGCIRLEIHNAKWIHDYIPAGTKVRMYRNPNGR